VAANNPAAEWFYQAQGQQAGPLSSAAFRKLASAGTITPDTLVCRATGTGTADGRWVRAGKVQGLFQWDDAPRTTPGGQKEPRSPPSPPPLPAPAGGQPALAPPSPVSVRPAGTGRLPRKILALLGVVAALLAGVLIVGFVSNPFIASQSSPASQRDKLASARPVVGFQPRSNRAPDRAANGAVAADVKLAIATGRADTRPAVPQAPKSLPVATADNDDGSMRGAEPGESKGGAVVGRVETVDLADLVERVEPSVVQLNVTGPTGAATGSGFVIDNRGTIVTNYHVIEDATGGNVVFSDKSSAPLAGYVGAWPEKDIALLHVECASQKLHPLVLATSPPRPGERVAAFGSPLGLSRSVSEGIVSAVRQSKELQALVPLEVDALLLQTTAPISHGNSGGPLVNMKGMVVGVNTLGFQPLGGENLNFAVSAVDVYPVLRGSSKKFLPLPVADTVQSTAGRVRRILNRGWVHLTAGELDKAVADYTEAIRLDPKNARAYDGRGDAYFGKTDWNAAIADYTEAIRLDPKSILPYHNRGRAYLSKGDYDAAVADCTEAIRLDPKCVWAYNNRGVAYFGKCDWDTAIADYTEAIRLDPKYGLSYSNRGNAYFGKRDYDTAIADYTEAIRLDPKSTLSYHNRGRAYYSKGDYDAAIADYTEVIRLGPKNARVYDDRGDAYSGKRDYDAAVTDYTEVVRLDPKNAQAYDDRGNAYFGKGDYDAAITEYTKAIRLDRKNARAYFDRGFVYWQKDDYGAAVVDLTKAIQLDPHNGYYYFVRGSIYDQMGPAFMAKVDFAKAKALGYRP
jgi:tetratricopeptide (TPR) repeat protein